MSLQYKPLSWKCDKRGVWRRRSCIGKMKQMQMTYRLADSAPAKITKVTFNCRRVSKDCLSVLILRCFKSRNSCTLCMWTAGGLQRTESCIATLSIEGNWILQRLAKNNAQEYSMLQLSE